MAVKSKQVTGVLGNPRPVPSGTGTAAPRRHSGRVSKVNPAPGNPAPGHTGRVLRGGNKGR
jgi:hypothetical protein